MKQSNAFVQAGAFAGVSNVSEWLYEYEYRVGGQSKWVRIRREKLPIPVAWVSSVTVLKVKQSKAFEKVGAFASVSNVSEREDFKI